MSEKPSQPPTGNPDFQDTVFQDISGDLPPLTQPVKPRRSLASIFDGVFGDTKVNKFDLRLNAVKAQGQAERAALAVAAQQALAERAQREALATEDVAKGMKEIEARKAAALSEQADTIPQALGDPQEGRPLSVTESVKESVKESVMPGAPERKELFLPLEQVDTTPIPLESPHQEPAFAEEITAISISISPEQPKKELPAVFRYRGDPKWITNVPQKTTVLRPKSPSTITPLFASSDNKAPSTPSPEELKTIEAKKARSRIKEWASSKVEEYNKAPTSQKIAASLFLVAASTVGTFTGATAVAASIFGAQLAMRGIGSYLTGRAVKKVLREREVRKQGMQPLTQEQEKTFNRIGILSSALVFLAGSAGNMISAAGQVSEYFASKLPDAISDIASKIHEVAAPSSAGNMAQGVVGDVIHPSSAIEANSLPTSIPRPAPLPEVSHSQQVLTGVFGEKVANLSGINRISEVFVRGGDTLSNIILKNGLSEIYSPEQVAKLTWGGKQNLIENIMNNLSPEQLKEIGISSGNKSELTANMIVNMKKFAEFAKTMTVMVEGKPVLLFERALKVP